MKNTLVQQTSQSASTQAPKIRVSGESIQPDESYFVEHEDFIQAAMDAAGTRDRDLAVAMITQLTRAQGKVSEKTELFINAAFAMLADFKCQNAQEAMMATHIIALYCQSSNLLIRAAAIAHPELQKNYFDMALKLSRAFGSMMETFQKHRRNGTYKMKIEHLHVHAGGQAIVGTVNQAQGSKRQHEKGV